MQLFPVLEGREEDQVAQQAVKSEENISEGHLSLNAIHHGDHVAENAHRCGDEIVAAC